MATIVRLQDARARSRRETDNEGSAKILFFTGVRYCRDEDTTAELTIEEAVMAEASVHAPDAGVTGIAAFN